VYEIDGDPVMLYNIAQAYRLNDQPQDAIHFYRRYLQRSPDARNKDDVERKIAAQEKLIDDRRKAAAAVTPPPPKPETPTPPKVAPPPPPPVVVQPPPPPVVVQPPAPPPSTTRRVLGWSMIGVGVASGVVAVIEGVRAKNFGDQLTQESMPAPGKPQNPPWTSTEESIQSSGKTANIVAIACGIGGAAFAVAGAVVLITNGSSSAAAESAPPPAETTTVSFNPWLGPGLVGGGVGLRF